MKKIFLYVLFIFCFATKNYSQDWITFNSKEGNLTILLPAKPTVQMDTSKTYPSYTTMMFISKGSTDIFAFGWVDYESSYNFNEQKELEANRDNFLKGINGTLVESKNTTFKGYKAVEFTATSGTYFWTSKVFLVGRRPYQLVAASSTGKASENEKKFYDSFSIKN
jgi:hypothetical protein